MTEELRELLKQYGVLSVTVSQLENERPGSKYESLDEYYRSLGGPLPDEPVLVVRISKDGEMRFLEEGEHDVAFADDQGEKAGVVTVWELPEDEFWFFRAFRPGLFDLQKGLPVFIYEMSVIHSYAMFESYLFGILRARLRQHPRSMGGQREVKYQHVFDASSKEALIEEMIDREIKELMYSSFLDVLSTMRSQLGFRTLPNQYDDQVNYLSLLRNCLLHNGGRVDVKLASCKRGLQEDEKLSITRGDVTDAVNALRKFACQIDQIFERNSPPTPHVSCQ